MREQKKKRAAINFIPKISNKISKFFKKYDLDIVFSRNYNLMNLLGKTKDKLKEKDSVLKLELYFYYF